MKFYRWLLEKGYVGKGIDFKNNEFINPKNTSSIIPNACAVYLIKGDSVFIHGLGQVGFPPHLLSPVLPNVAHKKAITREVISSGIVDKMDCQEAYNILFPLSIQTEWLSNFKKIN